jgi:hypothetical protein
LMLTEPCPRSPTGQHVPAAPSYAVTPGGTHEYAVECACCGATLRRANGDFTVAEEPCPHSA